MVAQGKQSLRLLSPPGRLPELTESQKRLMPDLLSHGAEAYGFRGDIWTCRRVKKVIEWEFGVSYHRSHVACLLKELHWMPQQPMERASQRNEAEISHWRSRRGNWIERKTPIGTYFCPQPHRELRPSNCPKSVSAKKSRAPSLGESVPIHHQSRLSACSSQGYSGSITVRDG